MSKFYKLLLAVVLPFLFLQNASAQSVRITGVVTSRSDRQLLPGVSVTILGTSTGTQTDVQGRFSLDAKIGDVLNISYLGFTTQQVKVAGNSEPLRIVLNEAQNTLNEVVVTALNISK